MNPITTPLLKTGSAITVFLLGSYYEFVTAYVYTFTKRTPAIFDRLENVFLWTDDHGQTHKLTPYKYFGSLAIPDYSKIR